MPRVSNTLIESIGVYLPEKVVTTAEVLADCVNPVRFPLEEMTGIQSRRVAGDTEFSIDLAEKAILDCLAHSRHAPGEVEILICANISRLDAPGKVSYEPSTSMVLRKRCGLSGAVVFDLTNACAGMFTGVYVLDRLIKLGVVRRGIVASGEYITHLTTTAQREIEGYLDPQLASLTLGDAGAAVLLEASPDAAVGFHEIDLYTVAKYSPFCIAKPSERGGATMATDTIQATAAGLEHMTIHSTNLIDQSQLPTEAYAHILPHQTSQTSMNEGLSEIARLFNKDVGQLLINNLAERGNTASNTHFVALKDQILNHRIQSGESTVFCISGSGMTVGTALYTFDDLPDRLRGGPRNGESPTAATSPAASADGGSGIGTPPRVRIESIGTTMARPWQTRSSTRELLIRAGEACLERSEHDRREIDLLISAGVYRTDHIAEPAMATLAAADLKINDDVGPEDEQRTFCFDLLNGSLGFLNACFVAAGMLKSGPHRRAMIFASEVENNADTSSPQRRGVKETASAVLLGVDPDGDNEEGFGAFLFKCFDEHIDDLTVSAVQNDGETQLVIEQSADLEDRYLACITEAVDELLKREGLDLSQIAAIFPPQISHDFIERLAAAMNVEVAKFIDVADDAGDLFTSSTPCALHRARGKGLVQSGDVGLIVNVAAGIQVGCAIYHF